MDWQSVFSSAARRLIKALRTILAVLILYRSTRISTVFSECPVIAAISCGVQPASDRRVTARVAQVFEDEAFEFRCDFLRALADALDAFGEDRLGEGLSRA